MSEIIIGIDLGTTNSCVAIKGGNQHCYTPPRITGYSVVLDRLKRRFTPSVLYYTGDRENPYEIGHKAKQSVDGQYPPVMFAKRHLGTDKKFPIGDDKYITPVEVSAEVLKYLKSMAEERLGKKIYKAVVTVPAYFGLAQKSLTKEAMEMAGFIVDDDRYIIIEPVAAALTYTRMVEQESHKIMVYDLGGGTFDTTILQKEGDFIEVVGFGGDHALGGYNFDLLLADYIIDKLKADGYQLELDTEKNPEDKIRYTKLMIEVENAKIELSKGVEYKLRKPAIFKDQKGDPVDLNMDLNRPLFESLIREKIDYTMELCKETLQKTSFDIGQIGQIILVGGSSYIPLVAQRLREEFGKEPEFVEPDLAVALGAAIQASQFGVTIEQKVRVKFDLMPAVTMFPEENISGVATSLNGEPLPAGYVAEINNHLGTFKENAPLSEEGGFFFKVPVQENSENIYAIRIVNAAGEIEAETELSISHAEDADIPAVSDQIVSTKLSKTIFVKRDSGMAELAEEGVHLPYEKREPFSIIKKGEIDPMEELDLNVELYEGDLFLGDVNVTGIPGTIESGEPVLVGIKITPDYKIHASAFIPSLGLEGKSVFSMNTEKVKSREELLEDLHNLENEWEGLKLLLNREDLAKAGVRIDRALKRAKEYLSGHDPDTSEGSKVVASLKQMLRDLRGKGPLVLRPSKDEFNKLCDDTRQQIKEAESKSQKARDMEMEKTLDTIIMQARQAFDLRDQENWNLGYRQVEELGMKAYQMVSPIDMGDIDPQKLLLELIMFVNGLRGKAQEQTQDPRHPTWIKKIASILEELKALGNANNDGELMKSLRNIYIQKVEPLRNEIMGGPGGIQFGLGLK
ncbi:MAG: Hsp70 family protein [Calditrichaceae bacterium]|nr:Hsp70 family protein [Calditrichia bacterium]NUQ41615.1 Hsp70 family protein [Calditrichaceae bacterium]